MAFSNTPQYSTYQQKQIPFYAEPQLRDGLTNKDQRFYNCFPESYKTPNIEQKSFYLRKRFGLHSQTGIANPGEVRGALSFEDILYFVLGVLVFKFDGITLTLVHSGLSTSTGHVGIRQYNYPADETNYILFADGTTLYNYNPATNVFATNPVGFPTPHSPYLEVMDGYILMVKSGTADIYSSQTSNWGSTWDFITAEMYPDRLLGLQRYNNYIMAVGTESIEMFYDAAIEEGSPFARNDSAIATIGCRAMGTAIQTDRKFLWLGDTQEGELSVWIFDEFKPVEIATIPVKQSLSSYPDNLNNTRAFSCRVQGHQFYVLCLPSITWVYDLNEKVWHQWTYNGSNTWPCPVGGEVGSGNFIGVAYNELFLYDPYRYEDNVGVPITVTWQTEPLMFDSMNRKFLNRLLLIGDYSAEPLDILVQWSDNNYLSFSPGRTIHMDSLRPAIVQCGQFRRRAFKFTTTNNVPMRLEAMEVNYNIGVN